MNRFLLSLVMVVVWSACSTGVVYSNENTPSVTTITVVARVLQVIPGQRDSVFRPPLFGQSLPLYLGETLHDSLLVSVNLAKSQKLQLWIPCEVKYYQKRPVVGDKLTCSLRITGLNVEAKRDPNILTFH